MNTFITICIFSLVTLTSVFGEIMIVDSLNQLNEAISQSDKNIRMKPGNYDLKDLDQGRKRISFSGSNNMINLKGVKVKTTVGSVRNTYIVVKGNNNTIIGGDFEDVYRDGTKEVTEFGTYNLDRRTLSAGLSGDAVMSIYGNNNTVQGIKLTVKGSWPYGYGSYYGIGSHNTFGLNKRCGILISRGEGNTIDGAELQMRSFGHGIYMQKGANKTVIKNTLVEGKVRKTADLYKETHPRALPKRTNYHFPNLDDFQMKSPGKYPIPKDSVHSLCEDGIRMYNNTGSVTVENCTVKKMRGGIRLYLGGPAIVKDCNVQHCQYTAYNLPKGGKVINSTGDFSFGPLSDYRSNRSNTKTEWTITPSPYASGNHNLLDLLGNDHHVTLYRTNGPIDSTQKRAIVVTGSGSTVINNTEYTVILEKNAKDNTIKSYGTVTDLGSNNTVQKIKSLSTKHVKN